MVPSMASSVQPSLPFGEDREPVPRGRRLMSVQDVAEYLDVPVKTIYTWRYHGDGPRGFRVGRHLRFRWNDVEAWVEQRIRAER